MVKLENSTNKEAFSQKQMGNKILYTRHLQDDSVKYRSTYTLKYLVKGHKCYEINNKQLRVKKGQYLLINNDQIISSYAYKGAEGISLFLSSELVKDIYESYRKETENPDDFRFYELAFPRVNDAIGNSLAALYHSRTNGTADKIAVENEFLHLTEQLVIQQLEILHKGKSAKVSKEVTNENLLKYVLLAREFIHDNLTERIYLDDISRNVGLSKFHLHRNFKHFTGCSPLEYLTYYRIENAKAKLKYSDEPIKDIAWSCGFENIHYFPVIFKKHTGYTPSQYRKEDGC
ncbi:helix-turn-helix domain-containing protein [Leptobacterium flavescens]|uniref:Helix-turn-helix domain-containing protein n=1 Tax=Leptobacterium flavescens TaxID=472055 RepID=A0A6P0UGZ7_9FLAO|nr:AraC family transcriptional regulator [Leptobacterium flavescens]NER12514.1 helix-turn-helix domain-containing protein [Leptobacterium flavescens]